MTDLEIERKISEGVHGEVYLVDIHESKRFSKDGTYAMKKYTNGKIMSDDIVREVHILNSFDHPNLMASLYTIITNDEVAVIMPAAKYDLEHYVVGVSSLEELVVKKIMCQLLNALAFLHSNRIIHEDVKLNNILMMESHPEPKVMLCDFTISSFVGPEGEPVVCPSQSLPYRPPELLENPDSSHLYESDIWALGIVFYELATGSTYMRYASTRKTVLETSKVIREIVEDEIFDKDIQSIVLAPLVIDPTKRPTAEEILRSLGMTLIVQGTPKGLDVVLDIPDKDMSKRKVLIEWMLEIKKSVEKKVPDPPSKETFLLAVDILDRTLTELAVPSKWMQLMACIAMALASDIYGVEYLIVDDFLLVTKNSYTKDQFYHWKYEMVKVLEWRVFRPSIGEMFSDVSFEKLVECYSQHYSIDEIRKLVA